ncbi:MAG: 1-acyl-sn-glycerol-3-phosphate acyltransferase [Clostridia bacterium]|nr:1-acyl-sn-glycerol-3-phosphate acyltransferase [Clostridia bacterium]
MNKFYTKIKKMFGGLAKKLFRVKVINPENEPKGVPFIVCCNHTSAFDVVVISSCLENQFNYMAKKELFRVPLLAQFIKAMGAVPVDRKSGDVGAVKKSIEILKDGSCMGIFPQGTRRKGVDPRTTPLKDGLGMLATRSGVGILPVCIRTKKNKLKMFHKTELVIGEYIPPEALEFSELSTKEKYSEITRLAFNKVCDMHDQGMLPPVKARKRLK